jgi:hypothetical protein
MDNNWNITWKPGTIAGTYGTTGAIAWMIGKVATMYGTTGKIAFTMV